MSEGHATLSRVVAGILVPTAGVYHIDPVHTYVTFGAQHAVVGRVRGRFVVVSGAITIGGILTESSVEIAIDPASLTTLHAQ